MWGAVGRERQRLSSAISGRRPRRAPGGAVPPALPPPPRCPGQRDLAPPRTPSASRRAGAPGGREPLPDTCGRARAAVTAGAPPPLWGALARRGWAAAGLCGLRSQRRPGPGAGRHGPSFWSCSVLLELRVGAVLTRGCYRERVSPAQQQQNFPACLFLGVTGLPRLPVVKGSAAEMNPV